MTLQLTPEILRAAYDFLNETPPFCEWNLPHGEDVGFAVVKTPHDFGWATTDGVQHRISVSTGMVGHTQTLIETMAHEMVHLHEWLNKAGSKKGGKHGAGFRHPAAKVCRIHGFDPKAFA